MTTMTNPTGLLLNTATSRYHPIVFRPAPLPGGVEIMGGTRYRSKGHHTDGFPTKDGAVAWIREQAELTLTGCVWEWNGTDVPAMTEFFGNKEVEAV